MTKSYFSIRNIYDEELSKITFTNPFSEMPSDFNNFMNCFKELWIIDTTLIITDSIWYCKNKKYELTNYDFDLFEKKKTLLKNILFYNNLKIEKELVRKLNKKFDDAYELQNELNINNNDLFFNDIEIYIHALIINNIVNINELNELLIINEKQNQDENSIIFMYKFLNNNLIIQDVQLNKNYTIHSVKYWTDYYKLALQLSKIHESWIIKNDESFSESISDLKKYLKFNNWLRKIFFDKPKDKNLMFYKEITNKRLLYLKISYWDIINELKKIILKKGNSKL